MTNTTIPPAGNGVRSTQPYVLGRDEGTHHHFLDNLATTKVAGAHAALSVVEFTAPFGFGPPLHRHDDEDELIVVLDGRVAFLSGDVETVAEAGATAFLPHAVPHQFRVLTSTARMLTITSRRDDGAPRFDAMVAALGTRVDDPVIPIGMEIDPGEVAAVCSAHGIEVLGPPPGRRN